MNKNQWNKNIRDSVDELLRQAGFAEDSSVRHQLAMMNFDDNSELFSKCMFQGPPPNPYTSWYDWAAEGTLSGVTIKTRKDFGGECYKKSKVPFGSSDIQPGEDYYK